MFSYHNAGRHDIAEILLKVALNTKKNQNKSQICSGIVRDTYYTQSDGNAGMLIFWPHSGNRKS
jgi:hypothetical protein